MHPDVLVIAADVRRATQRLVATVERLHDGDLAASSRCPGWTRGHVLSHVARNAEALGNLVTWAASGVETPMYPSPEAREADIEAGADRSVAEHVADLVTTAAALEDAVEALPAERFDERVRIGAHDVPAREILTAREREVELHHVDLDAGYSPSDWPDGFVERALPFVLGRVGAAAGADVALVIAPAGRDEVTIGGPGPLVRGAAADVTAWLFGRGGLDRLAVEPPGPVPEPPLWQSA